MEEKRERIWSEETGTGNLRITAYRRWRGRRERKVDVQYGVNAPRRNRTQQDGACPNACLSCNDVINRTL